MFWNKIEQLNQVRPMHNLNRNVFVAQRTVAKKRFLRHNRCIELGKRYVALR